MLRTFLIRRSKAEVLSDLPPKTRQTVRNVELSGLFALRWDTSAMFNLPPNVF
jgi:SNF2 family DNA or RNA helicase